MHIHIVLRTCYDKSVHFKERFIPLPKGDIVLQCLRSLLVSLGWLRFRTGTDHSIQLSVIDDHSPEEFRRKLMEVTKDCWFPVTFISLTDTGNNASMKAAYLKAAQVESDLVYVLEDDYLHCPSALTEMILDYQIFHDLLKKQLPDPEVAMMPVDNRFHYADDSIFSSPILMGTSRHWRMNFYSNMTLLLSRKALLSTWDTWWAFSDYQLSRPETFEDALLTPLFREKISLFTPIPTLAFHVAGHRYESPYVPWRSVWAQVDQDFQRFSGTWSSIRWNQDLSFSEATIDELTIP